MKRKITSVAGMLIAVVLLTSACNSATQVGSGANQAASTGPSSSNSTTSAQPSATTSWPVVANAVAPDSPEAEAIKTALVKINKAELPASQTFDVSQLSTVFVDDPAVPLNPDQANFVQKVRQLQGVEVAGELQGNGYLTYMKAFYLDWKRGAEGWDRFMAKAKAEGREPTGPEISSITGTVGFPAHRNNPKDFVSADDFNSPAYYHIEQIKVDSKWADVTYNAGAHSDHAFFVRTSDGWKMAGQVSR